MNKLSIIIPAYNEEKTLPEVIEKVLATEIPLEKEIIVVDDSSKDETAILAEKLPHVKLLRHENNKGKGAALATGIEAATGDIVIVQDADLEYDPNDYGKIIAPIINHECAVCYGSRFLGQKAKGYLKNRIANKFLSFFSNIFTGLDLTDVHTCYKAFRIDIIKSIKLEEKRFGFCPEVTVKVAKLLRKNGEKIKEVPISYFPRTTGEGKKIGWKDGFRAIWCTLIYSLKK